MILELGMLLLKYKDRFADEDFYKMASNILAYHAQMTNEDYRGIEFVTVEEMKAKASLPDEDLTLGFFDDKEKKIYLIFDNIQFDTRKRNDVNLTMQEHYIFSNLYRLGVFLHEFEHAAQVRGKDGLEGALVNDLPSAKGYEQYTISPRETFAKIYTDLIIYFVAKNLGLPEDVLKKFSNKLRIDITDPYFYIQFDKERVYKDFYAPAYEFFSKVHKTLDIDYNMVNELSDFQKMIFGLPVVNEDINMEFPPEEVLECLQRFSKKEEEPSI